MSYIGYTKRLATRIDTHNRGKGAKLTVNESLMPWAALAFVTGFNNAQQQQQFEATWKIQCQIKRNIMAQPEGIISIGKDAANQFNTEHHL